MSDTKLHGRRFLIGSGVAACAAIWVGIDAGLFGASASGGVAGKIPDGQGLALPPGIDAKTLELFSGSSDWINSPPLNVKSLSGKVVLVNFWTYSCINSLRPLPYLKVWADKYHDAGLMVVGVHAPEFGFEHFPANVRQATKDLGIQYPVALDSDYRLWRAFGNHAWPGFHFIGADGRIRDQTAGEGDYVRAERLLQRLLSQAGTAKIDQTLVSVSGNGTQAAPDWGRLGSPESYVGYEKSRNFASPNTVGRNQSRAYTAPLRLALNDWALAGAWTIGGEFAVLDKPTGGILHRFRARDLHMVLGGPQRGGPVRFKVTIDGEAPGADHGTDTNADGEGMLGEDRLYQLVRQTGRVEDRTFEIRFAAPGARAYAFTFG